MTDSKRDFSEINPSTQPNHIHCTDLQFGIIDMSTHRVNIQTFQTVLENLATRSRQGKHQLIKDTNYNSTSMKKESILHSFIIDGHQ
jgi:hypothetical protein